MAEPQMFTGWARAITPLLYERACLLSRDPHLAEDLVQDTLTKLFLAWPRIDLDHNPDGYAMRTLFHQFMTHRRRRSTSEVISDALPDLLHLDVGPEQRVDLTRALEALRPAERALVVARYVDDLSVADAAELLGRTPGWVKVTASRALRKLRLNPQLLNNNS